MKPTEIGVTFQIPKFEAEVGLLLADNRYLNGRIFLPIVSSNPLGHMPLDDWMNEPADFFPFLPEKSKEAEILSKYAVVQAVINIELDLNEIYEMMEQTVWIERIEVRCEPYASVTGSVLLNLPPGRSRVLDFLNQPTRFFTVSNASKNYVIHKRYVTSVKEMPSLPAPEPIIERKKRGRSGKSSNNIKSGRN
jgi:hypothetical protein